MSTIVVVMADAPEEEARRAMDRLLGPGAPPPEVVVRRRLAIATDGPGAGARQSPETQVATSASRTICLALDGRVTNRADLKAALECAAASPSSDAALFLLAYERWGEAALSKVEGSFAVAIVDERDESVLLARDAMGHRSLFYWSRGDCLVVASEEVGVLSHPDVGREPDRLRLAAHFGMVAPESGATFYRDVREVPPAHTVTIRGGRVSVSRYWEPAEQAGRIRRSDAEWAEIFRERLGLAVARCLPASGGSAVLLSGGLDSCPIAALAARQVAPARLTAISWVFDELEECDERPYIDEVAGRLGLERISILGDGLWPLSGIRSWPTDPGRPEHDPYRRLLTEGYRAAREAGVSALLSGFAGDHLYFGAGSWFIELLKEGRPLVAFPELLEAARAVGLLRAVRPFVVSPLVPRWLRRQPRPRPWLTPAARRLLFDSGDPALSPEGQSLRRQALLSEWTASCTAREARHASRVGVDLCFPFRDKGVIELALSLPAHQLGRGRTSRPVVRRAFDGLLPDAVVRRHGKTSLNALSDRGLYGPGRQTLEELLAGDDHLWAEFVEPRWVAEALRKPALHESEAVAIWYCAFVDLWTCRMLESS